MIGGRGLLNEMQKRSNYWERNTERVIDEILNSASTFRKKAKKEESYTFEPDANKKIREQLQLREGFLNGYYVMQELAQYKLARKYLESKDQLYKDYKKHLPDLFLESFKQEVLLTIKGSGELGRGRITLCSRVSSEKSLSGLRNMLSYFCSGLATRIRHGFFGTNLVSQLEKIIGQITEIPQPLAAPAQGVSSQASDNTNAQAQPSSKTTFSQRRDKHCV